MNQGLGQFLYGIPSKNPCENTRFITLYTKATNYLQSYMGFSFDNRCVKIEAPTDPSLNVDWKLNRRHWVTLNNPQGKDLIIKVAMAENETVFNPETMDITGFDINIQSNLEFYEKQYAHLLDAINEVNHPNLKRIKINSDTNSNTYDFRRFTALENLSVNNSVITSVNVSGLTTLKKLSLFQNPLTSIDVTTNINLEELNLQKEDTTTNHLTTLDVTNNTQLKKLNVQNTNLTNLDLTNNTQLTHLDGSYMNNMTEIDLSKCNNLVSVYLQTGTLNGNPVGTWNTVYVNQIQLNKLNAGQLPDWHKPQSANYVLKP